MAQQEYCRNSKSARRFAANKRNADETNAIVARYEGAWDSSDPTPKDVEDRMREQLEKCAMLGKRGSLTPEWEIFRRKYEPYIPTESA